MPTREDILRELGLAPLWHRRAVPGFGRAPAVAPPLRDAAANTAVDTAPPPEEQGRARPAAKPPPTVAVVPAVDSAAGAADPRAARIAALAFDELPADIAQCTACGLCRTRTNTVPGVGPASAEWMFIGEAPGADEDAQGEPFVGQAGRLLDAMLAAIGLDRRKTVYIANVLKCRPPGNRTPEPKEVEACRPYLERQIALVQPKLIVALGKSAATTLLGTEATIASLRRRVHAYGRTPLVVTYHPAYLLRNLPDKAKAWEDLLFARRCLREADDDPASS